MAADGEFITIARVARVRGRRGEVAADLYTDFPERFAERRRLFALTRDGFRRELLLDGQWMHKGRIVLKFQGVDTIAQAEELVGSEIQVPRAERVAVGESAAYISDLVGCTVFDGRREIGRVTGVQFGAGDAPLLVLDASGRELLLPFACEYLVRIDIAGRRLETSLPEGLLELDHPLTEEEKHEQQS